MITLQKVTPSKKKSKIPGNLLSRTKNIRIVDYLAANREKLQFSKMAYKPLTSLRFVRQLLKYLISMDRDYVYWLDFPYPNKLV